MNKPLDATELGQIGLQNTSLVCKLHLTRDWCRERDRAVAHNQDAPLINADARYQIPVFPSGDIFVTVVIGTPIPTGQALMWMEFTPDFGRVKKIPLGFWNPGEGFWSIRTVILDYLKSKLDLNEKFSKGRILTTCPARSLHNMRASRIVKENASADALWKSVCLWNIVMEGACTVCLKASAADPDNYGLTPDSTGTSRSSGSLPF